LLLMELVAIIDACCHHEQFRIGAVLYGVNVMATWGVSELVGHLEKLLVPGVIGLYHSFEVTEIVGFQNGEHPRNFLSLFVAEPDEPPAMSSCTGSFINSCPIRLRGSRWKFGILRQRISCQHLVRVLHQFRDKGEWRLNDKPLSVGGLTAVPPQYVPADSNQPHPWNGVLKNNFWGGSRILAALCLGASRYVLVPFG